MRKTFISLLAVLLLAAVLCGCTPKPVSEAQIKRDLEDWGVWWEIESVYITNRLTDTKNGTDTIDVDVYHVGKGGSFEYTLEYRLYDQGWSLIDVEKHFIVA